MTEIPWSCSKGFLLLCLCLSIVVKPSFGKTISETWEVEYMHWSPDCVESIVMGINGKFPGPEIRARVGDTLKITVNNKLSTEGLVIHWHGILQKETPWADGTASISQCSINPGESFVYEFKVDKAGTYFYHGHYGMQRAAGLYGSLIVELPKKENEPFPIPYDGEFNLLLSDWWHQSTHRQEVDLTGKPFRFIGEPQTLLINGKGQYNCSLAPSDPSSETQCTFDVTTKNGAKLKDQCGPEILSVEPGKTYRLRVASTTSLSSLNLQIANHKMKVVEADGNYVEPFDVDDLDIYSGESYSVLVTADQDVSKNYWISVGVRGRKPNTNQTLALLSYSAGAGYPNTKPPVTPRWDDYAHSKSFIKQLKANTKVSPKPPQISHKQIKLLNSQAKVNDYLKWAINGISLALPSTPYLGSIKYNLKNTFDQNPPPEYPESYDIDSPENYPGPRVSSGVYTLIHNQIYDVVLQNANMLNVSGHSEIHPWHLHGHDFWVLGYGEGKFSEADIKNFNLKNPPLKNTVSIFPHGWTALRFVADNPGVWAFHCHIEPHLHMGMGVIFVEAINSIKKMKVPNEAVSCGHTAKFLMNGHHHHHHHRHHRRP